MYRKRAQGWMKHADFVVQELFCFQLAFCIACIMRHGCMNPYRSVLYRNTAVVAALIQIFVLISFNVFKNILRRGYYQEFINSLKTVGIVMLLMVFYLFLIQQGGTFSRIVLIATAGYYWVFCYLLRSLRKYFLRKKIVGNQGKKSLVIITTEKLAGEVVGRIQERNVNEFVLNGLILVDCAAETREEAGGIPVVAVRQNAAKYLCRGWVDEVFLDVPCIDSYCQGLMQVMEDMGIVIHLRIRIGNDMSGQKKSLQKIGDCTVLTMSSNILNLREVFAKRLIDILGGLAGCLVTGLLFLVLAPAIYIQSPGPIFFSQMRVGRNGKIFNIYKFRSMYPDAEERKAGLAGCNEIKDGMMFKMENDPRIIGSEKGAGRGIGNFIRKTSLDEFPQFFNVLKGEMSLVGTRPPTVDEWERYSPHHRSRLSIKPGLTGMWQVSGRSNVQDFEEVVSLDRQYIEEWSLSLDIKILLKTVVALLKKEGAR